MLAIKIDALILVTSDGFVEIRGLLNFCHVRDREFSTDSCLSLPQRGREVLAPKFQNIEPFGEAMGVGPHAIELTRIIQEKGFLSVMHPLAVKVAPPVPNIDVTVDWNYPALFSRASSDIEIIRDSDHGFIASPTEMSYSQDYPIEQGATRRARTRNLIEWINMKWPLNFHVLQASDFVRIHAGDIGPEWSDAETELDKVCGPYLAYVKERAPVFPEGLRGSSLELLSPAVRSKLSVQMKRALRVGLRRGPVRLRRYLGGGLRRIIRRLEALTDRRAILARAR